MKVIIDVVNGEKMKELTAEIKAQEENILRWNKAMQTATPTMQNLYQVGMIQSADKITLAKNSLQDLSAVSGHASQGFLQLGYAIDDLQYGFSAIVNNIPQVVMGLGGSASVAGGAAMAAVAVNLLISHWAQLTAAFEQAWTGGSYDQLVTLKERADAATVAYEKLQKAKTQFEGKGEKIINQAIADAGADRLRTEIAGALITGGHQPMANEEDFRNLQGIGVKGMRAKGATEEQIMEERRKKQMDDARKQAEQLIAGLSVGGMQEKAARDMMTRLQKENPQMLNAFPEFKKGLAESEPGAIKDQEEQDKKDKARAKEEEGAKKLLELQKKQIEEQKKAIHERIQGEKTARIQSLEDERTAIQKKQHDFDEKMWERMHQDRTPGQIMQGARAATDYYQGASRGADDPKQLAKEAHAQREKTNKLLEANNELLKKERRLVVPH